MDVCLLSNNRFLCLAAFKCAKKHRKHLFLSTFAMIDTGFCVNHSMILELSFSILHLNFIILVEFGCIFAFSEKSDVDIYLIA